MKRKKYAHNQKKTHSNATKHCINTFRKLQPKINYKKKRSMKQYCSQNVQTHCSSKSKMESIHKKIPRREHGRVLLYLWSPFTSYYWWEPSTNSTRSIWETPNQKSQVNKPAFSHYLPLPNWLQIASSYVYTLWGHLPRVQLQILSQSLNKISSYT